MFEAGIQEELSQTHRDLVQSKATPSGLSILYGRIPHKFFTITQISGLNVLFDTLVCRIRWDNPTIIRERDIILGPNLPRVQVWL